MNQKNITIIKKVYEEEGGHGSHGAWKIAYADFMTALMAFFLVMWLTSSISEESKLGISKYFSPVGVSAASVGTNSVMEGGSNLQEFQQFSRVAFEDTVFPSAPKFSEKEEQELKSIDHKEDADKALTEAIENAQQTESHILERAQEQILEAIKDNPKLAMLKDNILITLTPEGLLIQLTDKEPYEMFPIGSKHMLDRTKEVLHEVVNVIKEIPNQLTISGHTDARPYAQKAAYDNWDLSTDRALEARRVIVELGFPQSLIFSVEGRESQDLLFPKDPYASTNRRISILVRRKNI